MTRLRCGRNLVFALNRLMENQPRRELSRGELEIRLLAWMFPGQSSTPASRRAGDWILGLATGLLGLATGLLGLAIGLRGLATESLGLETGLRGLATGLLGLATRLLGLATRLLGLATESLGLATGLLGLATRAGVTAACRAMAS